MNVKQSIVNVAAVLALAGATGVALYAQPEAPSVVPDAPTNLRYVVNGRTVNLSWLPPATGNYTSYLLEAGGSPGTTFFTFPTSQLAGQNLVQYLASFATGGVANGNYYVRIRAVNAEGAGAASNEVIVPVTGACQAPGSPTDLTAITRGSTVRLGWNVGSGGQPASYTLLAAFSPGGAPIAQFGLTTGYTNVGGVPAGTYYVRVVASNACGASAASNEITVTAPGNSPARTPNAASGRLPFLFFKDIIDQVASSQSALLVSQSCPTGRKYETNPYQNVLVDQLRAWDTRWGYNAKPTRTASDNNGFPVVCAGDEIAYHYGSDAAEGSPNTYMIDVISGHCGATPGSDYRIITPTEMNTSVLEFGKWTGANRVTP